MSASFFFFSSRRRHTRLTCDWSSDVCSSDLDEAAAKLRTEIDSMPSELDEIHRRVLQLEIEREALKKETDAGSKDRLTKLEKELANLKSEEDRLKAQWQ